MKMNTTFVLLMNSVRQKLKLLSMYMLGCICLYVMWTFVYTGKPSHRSERPSDNGRPPIYVVTATYGRAMQLAELTKLGNTLSHVPSVMWLLVEDAVSKSALVERFLARSGVSFVHLTKRTVPTDAKDMGNTQKTHAIEWLREHRRRLSNGMVYIVDDDNTYSVTLFKKCLSTIRPFMVWPVAYSGGLLLEGPRQSNGVIVSWNIGYGPDRGVPIDMAGFAVSLELLLSSRSTYKYVSTPCRNHMTRVDEACFIRSLNLTRGDAMPCATNETLVWHVKTIPSEKLHRPYKGWNDSFGQDV